MRKQNRSNKSTGRSFLCNILQQSDLSIHQWLQFIAEAHADAEAQAQAQVQEPQEQVGNVNSANSPVVVSKLIK